MYGLSVAVSLALIYNTIPRPIVKSSSYQLLSCINIERGKEGTGGKQERKGNGKGTERDLINYQLAFLNPL